MLINFLNDTQFFKTNKPNLNKFIIFNSIPHKIITFEALKFISYNKFCEFEKIFKKNIFFVTTNKKKIRFDLINKTNNITISYVYEPLLNLNLFFEYNNVFYSNRLYLKKKPIESDNYNDFLPIGFGFWNKYKNETIYVGYYTFQKNKEPIYFYFYIREEIESCYAFDNTLFKKMSEL